MLESYSCIEPALSAWSINKLGVSKRKLSVWAFITWLPVPSVSVIVICGSDDERCKRVEGLDVPIPK